MPIFDDFSEDQYNRDNHRLDFDQHEEQAEASHAANQNP